MSLRFKLDENTDPRWYAGLIILRHPQPSLARMRDLVRQIAAGGPRGRKTLPMKTMRTRVG